MNAAWENNKNIVPHQGALQHQHLNVLLRFIKQELLRTYELVLCSKAKKRECLKVCYHLHF